ncbi:MAG TPA: trypsin-like serine protease [Pirellulales bacterium]|jgi:hypothetical protein|nr:trypsin-like serine protease [Pirellulales bacterium]
MACFALLAILTSHASAVVILNTDGTANNGQTTDPGTGVPYSDVGVRGGGGASVVYLGNDWVLTANHVTIGNGTPGYDDVQLGGQDYTVGFTEQVYNSAANGGSPTDLKLVHLLGDPTVNLPTVQIATSAPSNVSSQQAVTMIGAGMDLGASQPYTIGGIQCVAYNLTGSEEVPRWGTNLITAHTVDQHSNYSVETYGMSDLGLRNSNGQEEYGYTFATTFGSSPSASNQEAQVTLGDSGGGVFEQVSGTWYLVGLIDGQSSPPLNASQNDVSNNVFQASASYGGERSIMIDLPDYNTIIANDMALVPEPSSFVLGGVGAILALLAGLHARRQRLARWSPALAAQAG